MHRAWQVFRCQCSLSANESLYQYLTLDDPAFDAMMDHNFPANLLIRMLIPLNLLKLINGFGYSAEQKEEILCEIVYLRLHF